VTTHDDYAGIARVNAALATPICGGELVWGIVPFRHMIEQRSVDYVMIDLARVGGATPWLKVAGMAEAFNLPVVSHVIPEIHAHLVAAAPNGLTVEYMGWMLKLFDGVAEFHAGTGELVLSDRPGLGLQFNQSTIDRCAVA
jgi:L-alanine-DL-glutamate epimerase-like enolase superfamily enzyme